MADPMTRLFETLTWPTVPSPAPAGAGDRHRRAPSRPAGPGRGSGPDPESRPGPGSGRTAPSRTSARHHAGPCPSRPLAGRPSARSASPPGRPTTRRKRRTARLMGGRCAATTASRRCSTSATGAASSFAAGISRRGTTAAAPARSNMTVGAAVAAVADQPQCGKSSSTASALASNPGTRKPRGGRAEEPRSHSRRRPSRQGLSVLPRQNPDRFDLQISNGSMTNVAGRRRPRGWARRRRSTRRARKTVWLDHVVRRTKYKVVAFYNALLGWKLGQDTAARTSAKSRDVGGVISRGSRSGRRGRGQPISAPAHRATRASITSPVQDSALGPGCRAAGAQNPARPVHQRGHGWRSTLATSIPLRSRLSHDDADLPTTADQLRDEGQPQRRVGAGRRPTTSS